jgi:hypothetical protein
VPPYLLRHPPQKAAAQIRLRPNTARPPPLLSRSLTAGPTLSSPTSSVPNPDSIAPPPSPPWTCLPRRGPHAKRCPVLFKPPPPPLGRNRALAAPPSRRRLQCAAGHGQSTAATRFRRSNRHSRSRRVQELRRVALHLLSPSPSPPQRRSIAAPCGPSRPPWLAVVGRLPPLPVQGKQPLGFPSVPSLFSPDR